VKIQRQPAQLEDNRHRVVLPPPPPPLPKETKRFDCPNCGASLYDDGAEVTHGNAAR
jgi:hypothetical protein